MNDKENKKIDNIKNNKSNNDREIYIIKNKENLIITKIFIITSYYWNIKLIKNNKVIGVKLNKIRIPKIWFNINSIEKFLISINKNNEFSITKDNFFNIKSKNYFFIQGDKSFMIIKSNFFCTWKYFLKLL